MRRADLRFHPETGAFEAIDGKSQFDHAFDDVGRRFICMLIFSRTGPSVPNQVLV